MNHLSVGGLTAAESASRLNQRAVAKQRTREKILAAAKALFTAHGYEGATIRDIAAIAGMSTGAVFASFTDKSDLFTEIAETEQIELHKHVRLAAGELQGRVAILAMLTAAAERQLTDLALVRATMSALWTPALSDKLRRRLDRRSIVALLTPHVRHELGCADADAGDVGFVAGSLWDAYLSTLRHAALDGLSVDGVKTQVEIQVRMILAGARRVLASDVLPANA